MGLRRLVGLAGLALALVAPTPASAAGGDVVISQIYGGGQSVGALYKNDYVVLHNRTNGAISLAGWSVQYTSATATGSTWLTTNLSGSIAAGGDYLVAEAAGADGVDVPTADTTGTISMAAGSGKVALVQSTTALTCFPCAGTLNLIDLVGYGSTANDFEGVAPAPTLGVSLAAFRRGVGCTDSNNNGPDFTSDTPAPRNSASAATPCGVAPVIHLDQSEYTVAEGSDLGFSVSATDVDGDPIDLTISSGPTGADAPTFITGATTGGTTGQFDWTPNFQRSPNSPYTVTFSADDGTNPPATANVTINVTDVNAPPQLTVGGDGNPSIAEGATYSTPVTAVDPDGDPVTISISSGPTGDDAPTYDAGTHTFSWTPGFNRASGTPYDITFHADDGHTGTDDATIHVTVTNTNRQPVVTIDPAGGQTVAEGQTLTLSVIGTDPDGDTVTFSQAGITGTDAPVLTPTSANHATLTWTPDFSRAATSPYALTLTGSDGALTYDLILRIAVTDVPQDAGGGTGGTGTTGGTGGSGGTGGTGDTGGTGSQPESTQTCIVPKLKRLTLKKAKAKLKKAHCKLGKVTRKRGPAKTRGRVLRQKPKAGTRKPAGARVALTLGR
jgi:Lamin Tail Domain/PASTA domain/Bacterial Ig domain